jgi:hypothetical protein
MQAHRPLHQGPAGAAVVFTNKHHPGTWRANPKVAQRDSVIGIGHDKLGL